MVSGKIFGGGRGSPIKILKGRGGGGEGGLGEMLKIEFNAKQLYASASFNTKKKNVSLTHVEFESLENFRELKNLFLKWEWGGRGEG